jgi:hypothetical protein
MLPCNFDWFLHAMLFLHTERVIDEQNSKGAQKNEDEDGDEDEDYGIDIDRDD